jgi:hypothetical protein
MSKPLSGVAGLVEYDDVGALWRLSRIRICSHMQERRLHPRYALELPVMIARPPDEFRDALLQGLSLAGAGLQVSRETVVALGRSGNVLMPGDALALRVTGAHAAVIDAPSAGFTCRARQVRRLSLEQYALGVAFDNLSVAHQDMLQRLLEEFAPRYMK